MQKQGKIRKTDFLKMKNNMAYSDKYTRNIYFICQNSDRNNYEIV